MSADRSEMTPVATLDWTMKEKISRRSDPRARCSPRGNRRNAEAPAVPTIAVAKI